MGDCFRPENNRGDAGRPLRVGQISPPSSFGLPCVCSSEGAIVICGVCCGACSAVGSAVGSGSGEGCAAGIGDGVPPKVQRWRFAYFSTNTVPTCVSSPVPVSRSDPSTPSLAEERPVNLRPFVRFFEQNTQRLIHSSILRSKRRPESGPLTHVRVFRRFSCYF